MKFAASYFLWLLWLVPVLGYFLVWAARRRQQLMTQFVNARLLTLLTQGVSAQRTKIRGALILTSVIFLIIAIARPQWGFHWEEVKQKGLDIIVAIDTSRSMLAEDLKPNRLERAKLAAMDLMQKSKSDRLGLIAFAGTAFLQCPLTLDEDAFRLSINTLTVDIMPQGGTAIAEAIGIANQAFKNSGDNYKVLVLFTDGEDHEEGVTDQADTAKENNVKVFTVGIGTPEGETLRDTDSQGRSAPMKDEQGNPVVSRLNEKLLADVANKTGGRYYRLAGAKTMDLLYEQGLAPLPKQDFSARLVQQYHERFHWPLTIAMLLLLIEILWPDRARVPQLPVTKTAATLLALVIIPMAAESSSPKDAKKFYEQGRYKSALEEYQQLLIKKPEDPRLHFNAGTAAFQAKKYDEAERAFNAATAAPEDLKLQQNAYYNRGNALYRWGEESSEAKEKKQHWQSATNAYNLAMRLNKDDQEARQNYEFVKKKLEELEQQQQNQDQKQDQDQKDQQDKDQQKDQQKKDQQKDQKQDQQKQDSSKKDEKKDQQKDSQPQKQDQKDKEQQKEQAQNKPDQSKDQQKQDAAKQDQSGKKPEDKNAAQQAQQQQMQAVQMTMEQAMQLLESQKSDERPLIFLPPPNEKDKQRNPNFKNW